ncbi:hypothetical protein [Enterobacter huaxiensis]|uniref:hypothetical protein n=1 Tax=Enterobacter huaxiensis TaxID=2494702 RepID=UPI001B30B7F0|nr:hypothetical protein [Enterobacter huaxiensis]
MSETIDKVLDAAKAVTTEPVMKVINQRLSNPFFLCFISSWIICNWDRVLLLCFSFSLGMEQRIEKVKALPSNSVFWGVSLPHAHTFWYPFIITVIFVVGTPFLSYIVDIIQNEVLTKKNTNDSQRKKDVLDLKINEINKNVEYEYADAKARLNAENANKTIEYSTTALEEKYNDMSVRVRDLNISIKEKEQQIKAQNVSYTQASDSLLMIRGELDLKGKELVELNSKIISNQKKLDGIKNEISKNTLPFTTLGNIANLVDGNGISSLSGLGLSGLDSLKLNNANGLSNDAVKLSLAAKALNATDLKPAHTKAEPNKQAKLAAKNPGKNDKNN